MPTIHIHIDNASEALDMVATLLRDGYRITLDSELVPTPRPKRAAADPLHRPFGKLLPNGTVVPAFERASTNEMLHDRIDQARHDARKAALKAARQAKSPDRDEERRVHFERHQQAEEARIVACPKCSATEGEFCRRPGGHHGALFVHTARHLATHTN